MNMLKAEKADRLSQAEDAVLLAVQEYREVLADGPVLDSTEITWKIPEALGDDRRFSIGPANTARPLRYDGVFTAAAEAEMPALQALLLALSPHWEDRIRAVALQQSLRDHVTLPDGFPCIYESAQSPRRAGSIRPAPFVWVASPDAEMLAELLPLYQELWSAYEAQWPKPSRVFSIGRLDGVSAHGVYRPGTTPAQVIAQTMLTHTDMYRTAPQHLKELHPRHAERSATARHAS